MASAFATEFQADAFPDLLVEFGEALTHRPLNVPANDASVTAIFSEMPPTQEPQRGVSVRRRAKITCASTVSASVRDRWQYDSQWWEAVAIREPIGGCVEVMVERLEDEILSGMKSPSIV